MTADQLNEIIVRNAKRRQRRALLDAGDMPDFDETVAELEEPPPEDDVTALLDHRTAQAEEIATQAAMLDAQAFEISRQAALLRGCDDALIAQADVIIDYERELKTCKQDAAAASNLADHQADVLRAVRQWAQDFAFHIDNVATVALLQVLGPGEGV